MRVNESDGNPENELSPTARRLVRRVLYHWSETAFGRGFPRLDEIDPWMIGDDWKHCLLVEIRAPLEHSRLLTLGSALLADAAQPLANGSIADCAADTLAGLIVARVPRVLATHDYVIDEGEALHRGAAILYRCVLLPLAEDGNTIDHILAAANYRVA